MPSSIIQNLPFHVVGLAASAGGLNALSEVLTGLPAEFPAPVVVVQHLDRKHPSLMAGILDRRASLDVKEAEDGEKLQVGQVYIAPPDHHLLVTSDGTVSLSHTELVHFVRPSADMLFESMAASYGAMAIAVVLSGTGKDGIMGVQAIQRAGGHVIAQDEATAEFFGMPSAAIGTGTVDEILSLQQIAPALINLTGGGAKC